MTAGKFHLKVVQLLALLSWTALAQSKICHEKVTEMVAIKKIDRLEMQPVVRILHFCCEGFVLENGKGCVPHCEECVKGTCTAPNECQCQHDHVKIKGGCAPKCKAKCKNGNCAKSGVCECYEGYVQSIDGGCIPSCNNCENGFCLKPNECQCNSGYKRDETRDNVCLPAKSVSDADFAEIPENPEVDGVFNYHGKKFHFTGRVDEVLE